MVNVRADLLGIDESAGRIICSTHHPMSSIIWSLSMFLSISYTIAHIQIQKLIGQEEIWSNTKMGPSVSGFTTSIRVKMSLYCRVTLGIYSEQRKQTLQIFQFSADKVNRLTQFV